MTAPYTGYEAQWGQGSPIAQQEWNDFNKRHKEMVDAILGASMDPGVQQVLGVQPQQQAPPVMQFDSPFGPPRPAGRDELIGQARAWGIANPEQMDAKELMLRIQQMRAEMPRDQQTSFGSASLALLGSASEAGGTAARIAGNIFGDLRELPFAGPTLASILGTEKAKNWMYDLSQKTAEFTEVARAAQPVQDKGAFEVMTASGKVAGYALPAMLLWNTVGAAGGWVPPAWAGRVASPFLRAAIRGGLVSGIMEAGSDEPVDSKVVNVGLGFLLGGSSAIPVIGASLGFGMIGVGIGSQVGDTPGERQRNAIIGGVAGATLGALPIMLGAAAKLRRDMPSPLDNAVDEAVKAKPAGEDPQKLLEQAQNDWRAKTQARATMAQQPLPGEQPDVTYQPTTPQEILQIRAAPAEGTPQVLESPTSSGGVGSLDNDPRIGQPGYRVQSRDGHVVEIRQMNQGYAGQRYDPNAPRDEGVVVASLAAPAQPRGLLPPPRSGASATTAQEQADALAYEIHDYEKWAAENRISRYASPEVIDAEGLQSQIQRAKLLGRYYKAVTDRTQWRPNAPDVPSGLQDTQVADAAGNPLTVYHGTQLDFEYFDMSKADPEGMFGPGLYHTEDFGVASGYADAPIGFDPITSQPSTTGMGPQVRPARLAIKNPFRVSDTIAGGPGTAYQFIDQLATARPAYDWETVKDEAVGPEHQTGHEPLTWENVYDAAVRAVTHQPNQGPELTDYQMGSALFHEPFGTRPLYHQELGKAEFTKVLEELGYDGITHTGGIRSGGVRHRVWIAFHPEQVYSPWDTPPMNLADAARTGDVLTKQATVMESSSLPDAMGKVKITDSDVVVAATYSNPAGYTVIRGLHPDSLNHQDLYKPNAFYTRVNRVGGDNTFDVIIAPEGDIVTPQVITEYEKYGVFTSQRVVTASGVEGEVAGFTAKGLVKVRPNSGSRILMVRPEKLLPSRFGASVTKAPDLYNQFKADLLNYMNEEAQKAQMAPVAGMWDPRVSDVAHERLSDFMDRMGIYEPSVRQTLDADFNTRWVDELRDLDPEMKALQETAVHDAYTAHTLSEEDDLHNLPQSIEDKAQSRGFIWLTQPGDGGALKDTVHPGTPDIPMSTDEAATEFLTRVDRALPDLTPAADMPVDVAEMLPNDIDTEPRLPTEHLGDSIGNTLDNFEVLTPDDKIFLNTPEGQDALARRLLGTEAGVRMGRQMTGLSTEGPGFGGAGTPPPPPPPSVPPSGGPPELPPGEQETLGGQFDKLRKADPMKLHTMIDNFQGLLSSKVRYMRYAMLNLEKNLTEAGVDMGRAWQHYEELDTARSKAFNEATPWIHEWGQIMREFPKRILRDGTVARIHGIEDPNANYAAWYRLGKSHGLSDRQITNSIAADGKITDFMQRFFTGWTGDPVRGADAHTELFRYMSGVRASQAQKAAEPFNVDSLSPELGFFGRMARDSHMQMSIVDARELGLKMIRSAMFEQYEKAPYDQLVNAWSDRRVPQGMRDFMLDWAKLVRQGYDPSGELAVRGIQSVMKKVFRTPLTSREAQHLLNMPTGAMYMSMLAGRTSIFFRDAIQPLLALAKVRVPFMAETYGRILKGAGQSLTSSEANSFREMYQRGLAGGWIERENPNIEAASIYEEPGGVRTNELLAITPAEQAHREMLARLGDPLWGLPNWLVRPRESNISTLKWYGRQGQLHRLITGESAYQQALADLSTYRRSTLEAVISHDPTREMPYDKFADRSFFSSFEQPIQQKLHELVDAGDDEGAAQLFAREVSNWSQFRYGRREVPPILRSNVGRALFMFGNFTGQFLEGMGSALANGTPYHKARYLMTIGTVSAAMYELKHLTGWQFNKWAWIPFAGQYTGGPLLERGARAVSALTGFSNYAFGNAPSDTERAAMQEEIKSGLLPAASDFFPYTGYIKSAAEYSAAAQGTNPLEQMARYTVTGDRGSRIDIQRMIEEQGILQGQLSPNGGLMPGQGGPSVAPYNPAHHPDSLSDPSYNYGYPPGYQYPSTGKQVPGAGAQP